MKRGTNSVVVVVFVAFVVAGLVAHLCVLCYPDHPYAAQVRQAFLAEGGPYDEPIVTAWVHPQSPD